MKQIFTLAIGLIIYTFSHGQTNQTIKSGGYISLDEFKKNMPTYLDTFTIIVRTKGDIKAWGGNDYKIESKVETTTKKIIRNDIWGVYHNDTLYINGFKLTGLMWFAKVEQFGKYCLVRPSFPVNSKIQKELGLNDPQYGFMFGAIGGAIEGAQMAVKRVPLIYCIDNGQKMLLNSKNILSLLEGYSDLKSEFQLETAQNDEKTLLKYLAKINTKK